MNGRLGSGVAGIAVAGMLAAAVGGGGQRIDPAPVPGPVGLSVGNESRMALVRGERWLERHREGESGMHAPPAATETDDEEVERLKPLLAGEYGCLSEGENVCEAWARLAAGLSRQGMEMAYLDGAFVPWRNAILHGLVVSQRPDGMGGGWWGDGEEDAARSTRAACATLRFLLGIGEEGD